MKAHATLVPASPGLPRWSPHLIDLVERGWLLLREQLAERGEDAVGVIVEHPAGLQATFRPRDLVRAAAEAMGRPLRTLQEDVEAGHVRVVVRALDGEMAACRIPLCSVRVVEGAPAGRRR